MSLLLNRLQEHVLLAPYTTLGIGGAARYFWAATTTESIIEAVTWATQQQQDLFVLGGGSNILVADKGFTGLVLQILSQGKESYLKGNQVFVTGAAGEVWDEFVAFTVEQGWQGLECLAGIPGRVGATPIQNVGAYGQEVKDTIVSVSAYDRYLNKIVTLTNAECQFAYRQSIFKHKSLNRYIVLSVTYCLSSTFQPTIKYPELNQYLANHYPTPPSLANIRQAVIEIRRTKAMVIDNPPAPDAYSVGSFFMNPLVSYEKLQSLQQVTPTIPSFPASQDQVKLSAAWLIEQSGFTKGYCYGGVGISTKHALALINRGGGTAQELQSLAAAIIAAVRQKFDLSLQPEPVYVGFESH